MLCSSGPWGSCSSTNICCCSSPKYLCTLWTGVASQNYPYLPSGHQKNPHHSASCSQWATLFSKWELPVCNTFSMLSGELSTASQSSAGAHHESHMGPHAIGWPLTSSIQWSLRLFYLLPTTSIVLLILLTLSIVLLYPTVCTLPWTHGRQGTSQEAGRKCEEL